MLNSILKINIDGNGKVISENQPKGEIYNIFKTEFGSEKYLNLLPQKTRTSFIKLRTANHNLPNETGRWCCTPKVERTCHVCNRVQIADELYS